VGVSEQCWYCHRPLTSNDIITAGTVSLPYEPSAEPPPAEKQPSFNHGPKQDFEDHLFRIGDAVESIFRVVSKTIGVCLIAALWLGLAGAIIYGLVRFVHWAWYQ
jgi:hypothetical protein